MATDARGRWAVTDANVPVMIEAVIIPPGDHIVADVDGVVVVPMDLVEEVLAAAEKIARDETKIREGVRAGKLLYGLYERYKVMERPSRGAATHRRRRRGIRARVPSAKPQPGRRKAIVQD